MAEFWATIEFWGFIVAAIAAVVGGILTRISINTQKKQLEVTTLVEIFKLLSYEEQRRARGEVFQKYWSYYPEGRENSDKKGLMIFTDDDAFKQIIKTVTGSFDQAGVFVYKRLVEPKLFFDLYAGMVTRTWYALEEDIKNEQKRNEEVCRWFEKLNDDAGQYFREKGKEPPKPYRKKD